MRATHYEHGTYVATPAGTMRGLVQTTALHYKTPAWAWHHVPDRLTKSLAFCGMCAYFFVADAVIAAGGAALWLGHAWHNSVIFGLGLALFTIGVVSATASAYAVIRTALISLWNAAFADRKPPSGAWRVK